MVETAVDTGFPLLEGFHTVQGFTCIVGVIQQVRKHCSFTGLPVQKGSNQQDSFKNGVIQTEEDFHSKTWVKKGAGLPLNELFSTSRASILGGGSNRKTSRCM